MDDNNWNNTTHIKNHEIKNHKSYEICKTLFYRNKDVRIEMTKYFLSY